MENKFTKFLNTIIAIIVLILIIMSLLAIIVINWNFGKDNFSFTPIGITNYLIKYGTYQALFTGTIATSAAYFGLLRWRVAEEANKDKLKLDRFAEWKVVLDIRFIEIEKRDPYMKREFIKKRFELFNSLYPTNFAIVNKQQLITVFEIFKPLVGFFETQNNKHVGMGGVYFDENYSYSFDSFRFLFFGCLSDTYEKIEYDLKSLYQSNLDNSRIIDKNTFQIASQNYRPIY